MKRLKNQIHWETESLALQYTSRLVFVALLTCLTWGHALAQAPDFSLVETPQVSPYLLGENAWWPDSQATVGIVVAIATAEATMLAMAVAL